MFDDAQREYGQDGEVQVLRVPHGPSMRLQRAQRVMRGEGGLQVGYGRARRLPAP